MSAEDVVIRPTRRDESSQLADLFARVAIQSALHLSVERYPDFYALYDIEHDPADQLVIALETGGAIEGIGAGLARDAHVAGRRMRVGYAADLRLTDKIRGGKFLGTYFPGAFRQMCSALGCEVMYTVVFDSNRAAQQAQTRNVGLGVHPAALVANGCHGTVPPLPRAQRVGTEPSQSGDRADRVVRRVAWFLHPTPLPHEPNRTASAVPVSIVCHGQIIDKNHRVLV